MTKVRVHGSTLVDDAPGLDIREDGRCETRDAGLIDALEGGRFDAALEGGLIDALEGGRAVP